MKPVALIVVSILGIPALALLRDQPTVVSAPTTAPDSLRSPAGPGSAEPNLALGTDGRAYLSWLEPLDSGHALKFSVYDGRAWSDAQTIRTGRDFFVNWADFPSIIPLDGKRLAAHWLQRTGGATYAYGVRVSVSTDGGRSWSAPVTPHSDTSSNEHGFVSLWREGTNLNATWLDGRKYTKEARSPRNEMTLMTGAIDGSGIPGPDALLDTRVCDCCQTSAAMAAAGPIVVYRDRSADEIRDIYVVRRVKGRWTAPAAVHNDGWRIAACPVNGPAVDANGNRVAVAWFTAAGDKPEVNLAFSQNGGEKFGNPIHFDDGNPAGRVDVALLSDDGALVTWIERTGGDTATVRMRRVDRKGKAARSITIATSSAARASGFPRMVIAGEQVLFAWTVPGKPSTVRVSRLAVASVR
jgi:hypothetical protein